MERNEICTDFYQIISGSSNVTSRAYTEAAKAADASDNAINYLKNFIASIENVAAKGNAVDKRICDSRGNIRDFVGYDNIQKSLKFLTANKTPVGNAIVSDLRTLHDMAEKYKTYYVSGYKNDNKLLMHEYECIVYLLVTGLSMALSFSFDVTEASGTTKLVPKARAYFGVTGKKIHEMAETISKKTHVEYLDELDKASANANTPVNEYALDNNVYTEGVAGAIVATVNVIGSVWKGLTSLGRLGINSIKTLKKTVFGIVPLIRGVIYLSYKRKADTILSLEQNIVFLEQNIEILNNKDMNTAKKEAIIKKQRAQIEAFRKRSEKLRAKLEEGEKDAAAAIQAENSKMGTPDNSDDDFVLEKAESVYRTIVESYKDSYAEVPLPDSIKERYDKYNEIEKKFGVMVPTSVKLGYAVSNASVHYKRGNDDINVDIVYPNNIIETSEGIMHDIRDSDDESSKKLLPLVALASIGNGDYDVVCNDGKMHYYSHDSKTRLKDAEETDPEKIYFVDSQYVRYDKDANKSIYIGDEKSRRKK